MQKAPKKASTAGSTSAAGAGGSVFADAIQITLTHGGIEKRLLML